MKTELFNYLCQIVEILTPIGAKFYDAHVEGLMASLVYSLPLEKDSMALMTVIILCIDGEAMAFHLTGDVSIDDAIEMGKGLQKEAVRTYTLHKQPQFVQSLN